MLKQLWCIYLCNLSFFVYAANDENVNLLTQGYFPDLYYFLNHTMSNRVIVGNYAAKEIFDQHSSDLIEFDCKDEIKFNQLYESVIQGKALESNYWDDLNNELSKDFFQAFVNVPIEKLDYQFCTLVALIYSLMQASKDPELKAVCDSKKAERIEQLTVLYEDLFKKAGSLVWIVDPICVQKIVVNSQGKPLGIPSEGNSEKVFDFPERSYCFVLPQGSGQPKKIINPLYLLDEQKKLVRVARFNNSILEVNANDIEYRDDLNKYSSIEYGLREQNIFDGFEKSFLADEKYRYKEHIWLRPNFLVKKYIENEKNLMEFLAFNQVHGLRCCEDSIHLEKFLPFCGVTLTTSTNKYGIPYQNDLTPGNKNPWNLEHDLDCKKYNFFIRFEKQVRGNKIDINCTIKQKEKK